MLDANRHTLRQEARERTRAAAGCSVRKYLPETLSGTQPEIASELLPESQPDTQPEKLTYCQIHPEQV